MEHVYHDVHIIEQDPPPLGKALDVVRPLPPRTAGIEQALREAGADLRSVITRHSPESPGTGVVFVTPLQAGREIRDAAQLGFNVSHAHPTVHVLGEDRPGVAAEITRLVADARINLRGFSGSVIGTQFSVYLALESSDDAGRVIEILNRWAERERAREATLVAA